MAFAFNEAVGMFGISAIFMCFKLFEVIKNISKHWGDPKSTRNCLEDYFQKEVLVGK